MKLNNILFFVFEVEGNGESESGSEGKLRSPNFSLKKKKGLNLRILFGRKEKKEKFLSYPLHTISNLSTFFDDFIAILSSLKVFTVVSLFESDHIIFSVRIDIIYPSPINFKTFASILFTVYDFRLSVSSLNSYRRA